MSKKELKTKKSGAGKFILGALVGAGLGVLFAPKSGSETRKELMDKMKDLLKKAKEIDIDEVKDMNGLLDDSIHDGQYLMIPYYE